jgi:hypothetical protein
VDVGERGGKGCAGRPVAGDAGDFPAREDLADGQVAAVFLGDQEAAEVYVKDLISRGGEAAALGFEEVARVASGAAGEADLGEGGGAPDDVGFRERWPVQGRVEPDRFVGIAVVVADAAVAVGPAVGDQAGAGERGAVEAARGLLTAGSGAVARDGLGRGSGRDREQAGQQERGKREQRYAGLDVSSSVIRVKN